MSQVHTLVRDLRLKRGRERRGLALAEGIRLVEEALAAGVAIRHVLASSTLEATQRGRALKSALERAGHAVEDTALLEFEALADTEHSQGVLVVLELPRWSLDAIKAAPGSPVLVLDGVQDPGNVGTMIRTAWALGAAGVLALPGTAELSNPKTLRATMGGSFHLPCVTLDEAQLREWAHARHVRVLLSDPAATLPDLRGQAVALVVGNEGAGIRPSFAAWADGKVGIPLRAAESLNVAVAAGILLYEVTRD